VAVWREGGVSELFLFEVTEEEEKKKGKSASGKYRARKNCENVYL